MDSLRTFFDDIDKEFVGVDKVTKIAILLIIQMQV